MFTCVLGPQSYQYRNLSESADRVGGHLRGDKECPCSGVTKSGRVWRKVPESDARIVTRGGAFISASAVLRRAVANTEKYYTYSMRRIC